MNPFVTPADRALAPAVVDAPSPAQRARGRIESAGTVVSTQVESGCTPGREGSMDEHNAFSAARGGVLQHQMNYATHAGAT